MRLRPGLGGDIFDLVLNSKTATIESIEQDFEDRYHVAVTLDDDPGKDLGRRVSQVIAFSSNPKRSPR